MVFDSFQIIQFILQNQVIKINVKYILNCLVDPKLNYEFKSLKCFYLVFTEYNDTKIKLIYESIYSTTDFEITI